MSGKLRVQTSNLGVTPNGAMDALVIEGLGAQGVSILTPITGSGYYGFGDATDTYRAGLKYSHSSDTLEIVVNDTTAITILSDGKVGLGTTSPNSQLHVAGPVATALSSKTTTYTLTATDSVILANAASAAFTINLPTAVGIAGRQYTIKKIDASANAVTLDGNGSQTIDGTTTKALGSQWAFVTVVSDGANWVIVSQGGTVS